MQVTRVPGGEAGDLVAVEEPLEIRLGGTPVAVTMRTPGHDEELALGFCLSEGLRPLSARVPDDLAANTVDVDAPDADVGRLQRSFYTSSSCGVCGKGALDAVAVEAPRVESDLRVESALVAQLPDRLREAQAAFEATGGLHATGLFAADGELLCVREDVGRHNALDKVVGRAFLDGLLPLSRCVLCVSGRLSFELVQKAAVAGCPLLVAVGAPSSLAVELAADRGITLCGFVRNGSLNVYTEPWRIRWLRITSARAWPLASTSGTPIRRTRPSSARSSTSSPSWPADGAALELGIGTGRIALPLASARRARPRDRPVGGDGRAAAREAGRRSGSASRSATSRRRPSRRRSPSRTSSPTRS